MHAIEFIVGRVPHNLPPVVCHVSRRHEVIDSKVILFHVIARNGFNSISLIAIAMNCALAGGEIS